MFFYSTYIMDDLALAEVAAGSLTDAHFPQLGKVTFDPKLVDNTRVVATITKTKPGAYGAIVGLGLVKQKSKQKTKPPKSSWNLCMSRSAISLFYIWPPGV